MLLDQISGQIGVPRSRLEAISRSASNRYKVYTIPKRTGGLREISQPSRVLKSVQRFLVKALISHLPVHESAKAYRKGLGLRENARQHIGYGYTLRMDFSNFFPSWDQGTVEKFIGHALEKRHVVFDDRDIKFIGRILCRNEALTIGAPSSPSLTNALMYDFDAYISAQLNSAGVVYTRYADDLFFSFNEKNIKNLVLSTVLEALGNGRYTCLSLNYDKTKFLNKAFHRSVTGLVITPQGGVSVGRELKRSIRTKLYLALNGELDPESVSSLKGYLAYINSVEKSFIDSLSTKFSVDVMAWLHADS